MLCVAGGALTVSLIPARRRGEGLALVGLVSGIPSVAPLGVWLAGHLGYRPVFAAGGLAALAGIASLPWLPNTRSITTRADGMLAALRNPALVRPAALFSATTMAVGIIVTFLPLAVTRADANAAALALLVQPAAAGVLVLSLTAVPAAVIAGRRFGVRMVRSERHLAARSVTREAPGTSSNPQTTHAPPGRVHAGPRLPARPPGCDDIVTLGKPRSCRACCKPRACCGARADCQPVRLE